MAAGEPRCAHYQFAHVALRTLLFGDPRLAAALWGLAQPERLLADIVGQVNRACEQGPGEALASEDLTLHRLTIGKKPCVVIEMPEPRATTEAFMVAIVQRRDASARGDNAAECRYFTLEYSEHRSAPQTVLGEWTEQGSHLNMGGGPEPTVEAFVGALAPMVLD